MKVTLIGVGSGKSDLLTAEAYDALSDADVIIGASRLIDALPGTFTSNRICAAASKDIFAKLQNLDFLNAAVVFSGDSGFYSGTRLLLPMLEEGGFETRIIPGISSVQMLASRLGRPWQDWRLVSAHGVDCDPVAEMMYGRPVFFLTGGAVTPNTICNELIDVGLCDITVSVGENLGLSDEKVTVDSVKNIAAAEFSPLTVMLIDTVPTVPQRTPGWSNDIFIRGKTPMTKQTVRAAVLSKLAVTKSNICWDIGAGTGSVSVELAAVSKRVYAVECDGDACELIRKNKVKFSAWNLNLTEGRAPEALCHLPVPDAVFIGGTKGEMRAIVDTVLEKNPKARICISAIAVETLSAAVNALSAHDITAEITQIAVSTTKTVGGLHMLTSNNPIFLITGNCQ